MITTDTGDAILADAVLRDVGKRPKDGRPFMPQELLNAIPNSDYTDARDSAIGDDGGLHHEYRLEKEAA